jgi:hypothetical protein
MKFLSHFHKINMTTKKFIITIAACSVCVPVFFYLGMMVRADNSIGDLQDSKSMILLRIEQTKAEYSKIAAERADAQEWCNIALQKGEEMGRLNALNEARRKEISLIDQKLSSLTASQTQNR